MKILYAITKAEWGGAQVHVFDLIMHAVQNKHECVLVSGEEGELVERVRGLGVKVVILETLVREIRIVKDIKAIMGFIGIIKNERPHIVHVHSSKAGIIGRLSCKLTEVPVIFTAHGWAFTEGVSRFRKKMFRLVERICANISTKIICVSDFDRKLALKNNVGNEKKLITIHNGVKNEDFLLEGKPDNLVRIIMVARFSSPKDYKTLLLALPKLSGTFKVLLVGDGELLEQTQEIVYELNLENVVEFLGMRKDVKQLLKNCDIFVLTSNYEGLPISIIEAMGSSLPVVASNVGGVNELVIENYNGFLVGRGDTIKVAESLQKLLDNKILREEMGQASYKRYNEMFTLEKMLSKTFSQYDIVFNTKIGQ
ncbi:glycosyltransferase family 4 protein [Paenibacillus sp. MBLB4367]|uniref:glycosyltransferase family 4 protein n=1 Tax=Paenibacillus sp. MBLB4367 TaxID=3384767 RepID=UPI0039080852